MEYYRPFVGYQLSLGITVKSPSSAPSGLRTCYRCHEAMPFSEFGPSRQNRSGLTSWCRACLARYNRDRRVSLRNGTLSRRSRLRQLDFATPLPSSVPGPADLAWAAGFLEGEGSFTRTQHRLRVKAVQVNLEPLLKLQHFFGGRIYSQKAYRDTHSPSFIWTANGRLAVAVVRQIYEMLSAKRQMQARAMMRAKR